MKRYLLISTFLSTLLMASETELRSEIDKLKAEIDILKAEHVQHMKDSDEIYDIAERAEANTFADKIKFGLGFKQYMDNFDKTYTDGHSVQNNNVLSTKLMLNMYANITPDMKFYGRLSMYKYWGSSAVHPYSYYDNMQGRVPADSALYVERAYIDYFMLKDTMLPIALTIGRQPSTDGPSYQFKDNVSRKATYSALLYDGASDGAVLTFNLSKVLDYKKTYLRFGYAKGYGYTATGNVGNAYIGASNNDIDDTNVAGVFLDTTLPNIKESLVQLSYSKMFDIVANPLDNNALQNKNIGDVDLYGAMIEVENIKNTHLDFFAHYAHSVAIPNGEGYIVTQNNQTYDFGGLLSKTGDTSKKNGDAIWLGTRYGLGENQKYKVGFEYNHGSKNWINLTQGSFDVYNKLATRGDVYEVYLMYVLNRYSNIRLGYIDIDYDYSRSAWFVGEPMDLDTISNDIEVDSMRSIYLKFNVNF